jgi:3-oxoacyl-[acyl-carrier protein] reductase
MDLGLKGKTALVLGGGSGLGRAIALSLAAEGAHVAVAGRHMEKVQGTLDLIRSQSPAASPGKSLGLEWDLSDLAQIDPRISRVEQELGLVDVLINNTGGPPPTTAGGQDPAVWIQQFQAMVLSVIAITDRVLPNMKARKWGRILTSTSAGVVAPIPNLALSNTLRASLVGWSKTLAKEVAQDGITANIVAPGRIATDRIRVLDEARAKRENRTVEDVAAESARAIPIGRLGTPEEYGDVVAFLASERASYVTGSIIRVDGGMIPSV